MLVSSSFIRICFSVKPFASAGSFVGLPDPGRFSVDPHYMQIQVCFHGDATTHRNANEDFRYMKIHIFALRWKDEIRRSSQLRTLLKRVFVK